MKLSQLKSNPNNPRQKNISLLYIAWIIFCIFALWKY